MVVADIAVTADMALKAAATTDVPATVVADMADTRIVAQVVAGRLAVSEAALAASKAEVLAAGAAPTAAEVSAAVEVGLTAVVGGAPTVVVATVVVADTGNFRKPIS
jgi:hypothetical protein